MPRTAAGPPGAPASAGGAAFEAPGLADWAVKALEPLGQAPAKHHLHLLGELQRLSGGDIDRLMVLMPPGSAKSTYASVLFPAWWFTQHPKTSVIAASHTRGFAEDLGRQVRNLVAENRSSLGYGLLADSRSAARWETSTLGRYFATGVRGALVGRRADLAIIDDPIRSLDEAESAAARDRLWEWYRNTLLTRLKPKAAVLLVMTRWHEDDLAGRLLEAQPAEWTCLRLPALAEADDPLDRPVGAVLWPEWEDAAALARKRAGVGERTWAAQFQQSPRTLQGRVFKTAAIRTLSPPLPEFTKVVRAWDLAATEAVGGSDPDWSVGLKLAREAGGRTVVLDVVRLRGSHWDVEQAIRASAELDGAQVLVGLPQDPGQAGKAQASYLAAVLAGYRLDISPETGPKTTRAMPVASQIEAGNLAILPGLWNGAFIAELRDFPGGGKDDQVDALSRAFGMLVQAAPPARRLIFRHMQR
jgi:predicted phage terminase large subunit-like protein